MSKYHSNKERLRAKGTGWDLKESRLAYLFMTPLLLCLIGFMIVPMFTGILLSFQNASGDPVGMENYSAVLGEPRFWNNVQLSLAYVVCNVLLSIVLGFLAANLITQKSKIVSFLRPVYLIPWIIPPVSSSILFRTLLDANTGPITQMIKFITGKSVMILDQADTALIAVIVHNFWRSFPFAMLFLAAGLTMISKDVYEAAIIDGASKIGKLAESLGIIRGYMDWCVSLGNDVIIHYPRIKRLQTSPLSYPVDIENQMKAALCMSSPQKLREAFRDFQSYFRKGLLYDPKKIKESYLRFIWSVINVAKELDLSRYFAIDQQALLESVMEAVTNEELEKNMEGIAGLMPEEKNDEDKDDNMRLVIRRTKSLIHEFYARGITLDEIAEKLNVTPEYLGSQFHKEVGVTFSTYMKEYRIQKAKKLLIGTNLKLYEVAEQVGYATPKYFSKIFKEVTGQFPAEYRKLNK